MMQFAYLATLLVALGCMGLVDHRWRLVLWADARRAVLVLTVGTVLFLAWDLIAVEEGFYRRGGSDLMTGVEVAPHLPLEEIFFVLFLCYVTLVSHRLVEHVLLGQRQRERHREEVSR